jgi:hypothetical protein
MAPTGKDPQVEAPPIQLSRNHVGRRHILYNRIMRMNYVNKLSLSFLVLEIFLACAVAEGALWTNYFEDAEGCIYAYDKESISPEDNGVIRVWTKVIYTDVCKFNYLAKQSDYRAADFVLGTDHVLYFREIDCSSGELLILSLTRRSIDGKQSYTKEQGVLFVEPTSGDETLRKVLCTEKK